MLLDVFNEMYELKTELAKVKLDAKRYKDWNKIEEERHSITKKKLKDAEEKVKELTKANKEAK